jgi:hypothetical protein
VCVCVCVCVQGDGWLRALVSDAEPLAFENYFAHVLGGKWAVSDPMRQLPLLPLTRRLLPRLAAVPGALVCALCSLLTVPLLLIARLCGGREDSLPLAHLLLNGPLVW